jgi:hypothetical protein
MPDKIRIIPMAASRGRVIIVLKNKHMQKTMKIAGTTGYPQTL